MTETVTSACPHDCPSACVLSVERLSPTRIGRIHGNKGFDYTAGVLCAKVARYAERVHHPDRLRQPLRRVGAKGEGRFEPIGWDAALDEVAEAFVRETQRHGSEAVWPYHSGGTMGIVQRWGLDRLRHVMRYSRQKTTICVTPAESGWRAGVGKVQGTDPREMAQSDLIVVWGSNPVSTQVNLMGHIQRARKARGARLVVVDCYRTPTVEAADIALVLRPGTDAALACAVMQVMLTEGLADRDYLAGCTDFDETVESHLRACTPAWAAAITGLTEQQIVDFARLYGSTPASFLRLGFGFTRARNGAANMHAVTCLPAVSGAWRHEGGGAFFINLDNWGLDTRLVWGTDLADPTVRMLDQSRIGPVLCGDPEALQHGPPVTAMLMQNANSATVAPDSRAVRRGLSREDLFLCVHEQFMTSTARYADILLPAAMFLEYDDIYFGLGHTAMTMSQKVLERYEDTRTNHEVVCGLAERLGADHPGFRMTAWELVDHTLQASGYGPAAEVAERGFADRRPGFAGGHFTEGFPNPTGRFRFRPDWSALGPYHQSMPSLPSFMPAIEMASEEHPFRLVAPPARNFLNTSFTETPSSREREQRPTVRIHPRDAERLGIEEGARVTLGNARGSLSLPAVLFDGMVPGTLIVEGIWPNADFEGGLGVNQLIGADPVPPAGGVAFHDSAVWLRRAVASGAGETTAIAAE